MTVVSEILNALFMVVLTCVIAWLVILGGIGAALAVQRGRPASYGFLISVLLPVVGWIVIMARPNAPRKPTAGSVDPEDPFLKLLED